MNKIHFKYAFIMNYNVKFKFFYRSCVKSVIFFIAGVKIANDFVGFDVVNPN